MGKITVCLLTYNRATWLPRTLDSILAQTHQSFELIISDNVSSDNTEAVCRDYARRDPRIQYYRNSSNLGVIGNYQAAFSRASCDYLAYLHDNDRFHPELLSRWVQALDRYPTAAFVFNAMAMIDFQGRVVQTRTYRYPELITPGTVLLDEMLTRWGSPVYGMVMVRRACVLDVGPFDDARFPNLGDVDMWMRLAAKYDVVYLRDILIEGRIREKNHFANHWHIYEESYAIQRVNIERRHQQGSKGRAASLRALDRVYTYYCCRMVFGWLRRGRFNLAKECILGFCRCPIVPLRWAGRTLSAFLPLGASRNTRERVER